MARKRSRYARLLRELKTTNGQPTADSELAKFVDFLTGKTKLTVANKLPEGYKDRFNLTVLPFAVTPTGDTASQRYKTPITRYSYAGLKNKVNLANNIFGIGFVADGNQEDGNFFPALIKPSYTSSQGSNPNKTSAVTGKQYNYQRTRTFSIPFGRTTQAVDAATGAAETNITDVDELDVLRSVRTAISSATNKDDLISMSYDAELFRPQVSAQDAKADTDIDIASVTLT